MRKSLYKEIAEEIMLNYPEYSYCLICTGWDYKRGIYKFYDEEENKTYTVKLKDITVAVKKFINGIAENKWFFDIAFCYISGKDTIKSHSRIFKLESII